MNVAAIVITYNDDYKIQEWEEHHKLYADELYLHIIVDNNSTSDYLEKLETKFASSYIIKRKSNGGTTAAYNDGIRHALSHPNIDAIMLIGNDIRIEKGGIIKLCDKLIANTSVGMIAPVVLKKDSRIIESFGCFISKNLYLKEPEIGKSVESLISDFKYVETVGGGMNLSTRNFYEEIGLQDEKLFMYSDEVDMGLRAKKMGFKMAVTSEVMAWHQHINPSNRTIRLPYSYYLIGRNKLYLAKKHFGFKKIARVLFYQLLIYSKIFLTGLFNGHKFIASVYYLRGIINGLSGNMKIYNFIKNNN